MSPFITKTRTLVIGFGLLLGTAAPLSAQLRPFSIEARGPRSQPRAEPSFTSLDNPADADVDGARISYTVSGGIAAVSNTLRVFDDGLVQYETSRSTAEPASWSIWSRIPASEVRALKNLVAAVDFASMPASFEAQQEVFDGFDYLIAVELRDRAIKAVRSTTGAAEDRGYTRLRLTLDSVVTDVLSLEILSVKRFDSAVPGVERDFSLFADGRFHVVVQEESRRMMQSYDGQLSDSQRNEIIESAETFDWAATRILRSSSTDGVQYEFRWTALGTSYAVQIDAASTDVELAMLGDVIAMINDSVRQLGD